MNLRVSNLEIYACEVLHFLTAMTIMLAGAATSAGIAGCYD